MTTTNNGRLSSGALHRQRTAATVLLGALLLPWLAQAQVSSSVTRTVSFSYDAYGTRTSQTVEPDDATLRLQTTYTPHPTYGVITGTTQSWQDPLGGAVNRSTSTSYDSRYRYPSTVTNAKGHTETHTYDSGTGAIVSLQDANGLSTSWQYDPWGRKTRESRADGTATTWAWRACVDNCLNNAVAVEVTQHWSGSSQTTVPAETFTDSLGRQVLTRTWGFDGAAILADKIYGSKGRVQKIARPRLAAASAVWTEYTRDDLGRVTQIQSPAKTGSGSYTTTFQYNGLQTTTINAKTQSRVETVNGQGKLVSVVDARNKTTRYLYDAFGNLLRTTDAAGNQVHIYYDRLGRKTTLDDPDLGRWSYVVDPLGRTRRQTDAKNQVSTFSYDELDRQTVRLEPDQESHWDYDSAPKGIGKLAEAYTWVAGAKDHRRLHGYDSLGRPSTVLTSTDWDYSRTQTYDAFGRPEAEHHRRAAKGAGASAGATNSIYQRYNAYGYVHAIERSEDGAATALAVWQAQAMDAELRVTQEVLGNGIVTTRGYNAYTGRLNTITSGPGASHQNDSYDYDEIGNLSSRAQLAATSGSAVSETFAYDELNRLSGSTVAGQALKSATYTDIGNLATKGGVGSYAYNPQGPGSVQPHAVQSISGTVAGLANPGFSYDANGNLLTGLARSYGWTSFNMPASVSKLSGASAVERTDFVYDAEHQRARQTVSPVSGGVTGAATRVIWYAGAQEKEIDAANNRTLIRLRLPMNVGFVEETLAGTAPAPTATGTRQPHYMLEDHLGSSIVVLDQAQTVLQRMSYDAWGRRRNTDGTDDAGALWGTLKNNEDHSGYTGHEQLDQLALVHMNARLYDPLIGRHTSADPTVPDPEDQQALNRYSYVLNNALVFVDPSGLQARALDTAQTRRANYLGSVCLFGPRHDCGDKNLPPWSSQGSLPDASSDDAQKGVGESVAKIGQQVGSAIRGWWESSKAGFQSATLGETIFDKVLPAIPGAGGVEAAGVGMIGKVAAATEAEAAAARIASGMEAAAAKGAAAWKGAGPIPGTFGVGPGTESVKGLQNFFPRRGNVEFIFDPATSTFVVGNGTMKHSALASSISADTNRVVGGIFSRGSNGSMLTNEASGHFWQNWNPQVRQQFADFMNSKGLSIVHREGM